MSSSQPNSQARQPARYPSPTGYPSPGMADSQYAYPVPGQSQTAEAYRPSPPGSNGSMALPSMSSHDPLRQHLAQHLLSSQLQAPAGSMGGPYYHNSPTPQHGMHQYPVTSDARFTLPQQPDQRVMSGGRHKKEIKRRTKTGCMTCRKRRIKCDEHHPVCRNCEKSKRECAGYDPVFKAPLGPAAIQPAPSSASPQVSVSAPVNAFLNQPSMVQSSYMNFDPALTGSPNNANQQFEYPSAIDPALQAAGLPMANADPYLHSVSGMPNFRDDLQRELQSASPYYSGGDSPHLRGGALSLSPSSSPVFPPEAYSPAYANPAKPIRMDELFIGLNSAPNPPLSSSTNDDPNSTNADEVAPARTIEIRHLYESIYSPGLENFLESKWFATHGLDRFLKDKALLKQISELVDRFADTATVNDPIAIKMTSEVYESPAVWALAKSARAAAGDDSTGVSAAKTDAVEPAHRLTVFENLVTRVVASENPLAPPPVGAEPTQKTRELDFWFKLAHFTTLKNDDTVALDQSLTGLRSLLDGRENRDILYSIAVVRSLGPRITEYTEQDKPLHLDESDPRSQVAVAKRFIKDEADGAGTTNVIRRMCSLAVNSWSV